MFLEKQKREKTISCQNQMIMLQRFFTENLLAIEMKKRRYVPIKLSISILGLSKILMYELWYDYVKPEYGEKANFCYMDTDSFTVYMKTENIHKDIAEDIETRFLTSNLN